MHKNTLQVLILLLLAFNCLTAGAVGNNAYRGNLQFVLGDVKQAQIQNKIVTTADADNLLDGFSKMGVNGIRVAIFSDGMTPNKPMYDYFHSEATRRGFKLFANPALHVGGKRLANGTLQDVGGPVKNQLDKRNALINRIKSYAQKYPVTWISPFNEDGRTGATWSANQISEIFRLLKGNLNGAELIGSCAWGIDAGIDVLKNTNIRQYISVATTHNLGFAHHLWDEFISEAGDLPVWDSETNNKKKFENKDTRIKAAVDAGVNGLVLYNSWKSIALVNGGIKPSGINLRDHFYKSSGEFFFIKIKASGKLLRPYNNDYNAAIVQAPEEADGKMVQWEKIYTNNDYFYLRNRATGKYFRPATGDNFSEIEQKPTPFDGFWTQWKTVSSGDGYVHLENRQLGKNIRAKDIDDIDSSVNLDRMKIELSPANWKGDWVRWQLIPAA